MVAPAAKRVAVGVAVQHHRVSLRRACDLVGLHRSTMGYRSSRTSDVAVRQAIVEVACRHPRRGYRYLGRVLRRRGMVVNHKRLHRLYRLEGLRVRSKRRRKLAAGKRNLAAPATRPAQQWCMDFVHDGLSDGRKFRVLNVQDVFTRESLAMRVESSISGARVVEVLEELVVSQGVPELITVDNGPEFIGNALDKWACQHNVQLKFSRPGKPQDNAFIESFNGRFRDECLNAHWFLTMDDAKEKIEKWRLEYNTDRMHGSLDGLTPLEFKQRYEKSQQRSTLKTTTELAS